MFNEAITKVSGGCIAYNSVDYYYTVDFEWRFLFPWFHHWALDFSKYSTKIYILGTLNKIKAIQLRKTHCIARKKIQRDVQLEFIFNWKNVTNKMQKKERFKLSGWLYLIICGLFRNVLFSFYTLAKAEYSFDLAWMECLYCVSRLDQNQIQQLSFRPAKLNYKDLKTTIRQFDEDSPQKLNKSKLCR